MAKPSATALNRSLAENAAAVAQRAQERRRAEARALIELIRRRTSAIAESFFDIGEALAKLRESKMYGALGYATFRALVEAELSISLAHSYKLMEIAVRVPRPEAVALGPARSAALLVLAKATPEPDSIITLLRDGVTLPGRRGRVDLKQLSTRELLRAARIERRAHVSPKRRATDADLEQAQVWARRIQRLLRLRGAGNVETDARRRRDPDGTEALRLRFELDAHHAADLHALLARRPVKKG